jgi:hypothetical protein
MITRSRFAVMAIITLVSHAGEGAAPFVRGEGVNQAGHWKLTAQQLAVASTWLQGRKPNCTAGLGSPPVPSAIVQLVSVDGSSVYLGFYRQPGYAGVVETHIDKNVCHFQGGAAEVLAFRRAIGEQP